MGEKLTLFFKDQEIIDFILYHLGKGSPNPIVYDDLVSVDFIHLRTFPHALQVFDSI
jgi:hypothetical protein